MLFKKKKNLGWVKKECYLSLMMYIPWVMPRNSEDCDNIYITEILYFASQRKQILLVFDTNVCLYMDLESNFLIGIIFQLKLLKMSNFFTAQSSCGNNFFNKSCKESNLMIDDPETQDIFILFFQNMGLTIIVVLY